MGWRCSPRWVIAFGCVGAACAEPEPGPKPSSPAEVPAPEPQLPVAADLDDDGFDETVDCDDLNPAIFPGAPERCDGFDQDCDLAIDEDATDLVTSWPDTDGDGYGDASDPLVGCAPPEDRVTVAGDCDDDDPGRHADAAERCDDIDDDCDPSTTEDGVVSIGDRAFPSIQAAIDGASDGDVITVCDGTYTENLIVPPYRALTLVSLNGPDVTILDGGGTGPVLSSDAAALTLEGLTFTHGFDDQLFGQGGGVAVGPGELAITGCVFEDNEHTDSGGALAIEQATATITDTEFRSNHTGIDSGAVWAFWSHVTVVDSRFEDNRSGTYGGAIYAQESSFRLERTTFVGNTSTHGGAAVLGAYNWPSEVVDCSFVGNVATRFGGAVQSFGDLTVTGTTFDGNQAENGGALVLWADASLDGVTIVNNVATEVAGGLLLDADVHLTASTVHSNSGGRGGGAGTASNASGVFTSVDSDWGVDATENLPEDVWLDRGARSFTATTDFTCTLSTGRCE